MIGRIQVITEVLPYWVRCFVKYLINWYNVWIKEEHCTKGRLALELIEVAWITFTL